MTNKKNAWIISFTPVGKEPRVLRQASWLYNNGFNVFIFGLSSKSILPKEYNFINLENLGLENNSIKFSLLKIKF